MEIKRNKATLNIYLTKANDSAKTFKRIYVVIGIFMTIAPLVIGLYTSERILPLPIYIPLLSVRSTHGFQLSYLYSVYIIHLSLVGHIVSESYFAVHIQLAIGILQMLGEMVESVDRELWARKIWQVKHSPFETTKKPDSPEIDDATRQKEDQELEVRINNIIRNIVFEHGEQIRWECGWR